MEALGKNEGCACFEPIYTSAKSHLGRFKSFVDVGKIEGYLDDWLHEVRDSPLCSRF